VVTPAANPAIVGSGGDGAEGRQVAMADKVQTAPEVDRPRDRRCGTLADLTVGRAGMGRAGR
jgi:hypothetical protein